MMTLAEWANDDGRARATQVMLADTLGRTVRTIERHMSGLLRPVDGGKPFLEKYRGRSYVILGVVEHDRETCPHPVCQAEAASDYLSHRRRLRQLADARRAKAYRDRKRATG